VYKLSADQARKLGFESLEEVALYGYPGMLPQVLDSAQLRPQEIPTWLQDNQLFFYLAGPHSSEFTEAGELTYSHHLYTDTLRYVLGKKSGPRRIEARNGTATNPSSLAIWYQLLAVKEEKINLLNSGRSWYSLPIRQGQSLTINFGKNAGISFNPIIEGNKPIIFSGGMVTQEGTSSVSNQIGELLFYTNGETVYTSGNTIMVNGTGLSSSGTSTQSAIIVPKPDSNKYYIFTTDYNGSPNGFEYSVVNMDLQNGNGEVETKNIKLINSPITEKVTACNNMNDESYWVIAEISNKIT
jgi:hypothetical protein